MFAPFLIKEKLEKVSIVSLILCFFGLILIVYSNLSFDTNFSGILFALASGDHIHLELIL